ncbi:uncharacterized protein LOC122668421 [Telopea speciosissima]|uniref:uncharacterized protein LOC122668421 n=1 Tax=Telopea speciosissima TaxID=54955 RepID=UPI001CC33BC4|nr:uncharacterized protein LOC122668421 [Telopea speciosissima]
MQISDDEKFLWCQGAISVGLKRTQETTFSSTAAFPLRKAKVVLVADIWKALLITVYQQLWIVQNKRHFESQRSLPRNVVQRCINAISDCSLITGVKINSVQELMLTKYFKVTTAIPKPRRIVEVRWNPPLLGWWKLNIDGYSIGNPGYSGAGGILRNHLGIFRRGFSSFEGIRTNFQTEMAAFFLGIREAKELPVERLWVECDSALVVYGILASNISWDFLQQWWSAESYLSSIQWRVTHCYREGNAPADALAKWAVTNKTSEKWDDLPIFIARSLNCIFFPATFVETEIIRFVARPFICQDPKKLHKAKQRLKQMWDMKEW